MSTGRSQCTSEPSTLEPGTVEPCNLEPCNLETGNLEMGTTERALDSLDHVAIVVQDIDQAITWYQTSFACELLLREKQQALLQFANTKLQLVLPSLQQPHLAFLRNDAATLGQLREQIGGTRSAFLADPTGNLVEVAQIEETSAQIQENDGQ